MMINKILLFPPQESPHEPPQLVAAKSLIFVPPKIGYTLYYAGELVLFPKILNNYFLKKRCDFTMIYYINHDFYFVTGILYFIFLYIFHAIIIGRLAIRNIQGKNPTIAKNITNRISNI